MPRLKSVVITFDALAAVNSMAPRVLRLVCQNGAMETPEPRRPLPPNARRYLEEFRDASWYANNVWWAQPVLARGLGLPWAELLPPFEQATLESVPQDRFPYASIEPHATGATRLLATIVVNYLEVTPNSVAVMVDGLATSSDPWIERATWSPVIENRSIFAVERWPTTIDDIRTSIAHTSSHLTSLGAAGVPEGYHESGVPDIRA